MARVNGNDKANVLTATNWADSVFGNGGNDTLYGLNGNDYLHGGYGIDKIYAGAGDDRLNLTTGTANYSTGNTALEVLDGGSGCDHLHVDTMGSKVDGAAATSVSIVSNGTGKFNVWVTADPDLGSAKIATTNSVESFALRADGPALYYVGNIGGTPANMFLTATDKADEFVGGAENSRVDLMGGNDDVYLSTGKDIFTLGAGEDTVHFSAFGKGAVGGTITDFNPDEDMLDLSGWTKETLTVTETCGGTMLSGGDDQLFLAGLTGFDPWGTDIA